jgi:site-specific recombinase XerC
MLSLQAKEALQQFFDVLSAKHYSPRTIRNYTREMRFLFAFAFCDPITVLSPQGK